MSMKDLNKRLEKVLNDKKCENTIIKELDDIIEEFGIDKVNSWRNLSNRTKNTLLHELVDKNYINVVRHVIIKYNLRTFFKRESDGATPIEVARLNQHWKMWDLLYEFGDDKTLNETYEQFASKIQRDKMMNIVWMDLEFTSFDNPKILECAVIITDKDLTEIARNEWVVHFDEKILNELGEWHQDHFKDINAGGNGLFKDVINSKITKEQMEVELLEFLKRHCIEKASPLAGSSIHVDKEVLKVEMPNVNNYLHYRVIDVSSFREITKRWAPRTGSKFARQLASNGREIVNHRAMDDIEWSIEMMKLYKPLITSQPFLKGKGNRSNPKDVNQNRSNSPPSQNGKLPVILPSVDRSKLHSDEKELLKRIEFEQSFDVRTLELSPDDQRIYDQNPHLREVFINQEQIIEFNKEFNYENRKLLKPTLNRTLSGKTIHRKINTVEYWKQRKTLLSEIEFLTKYSNEENWIVIYAGAAPGIHLSFLSSLFPTIHFILIDQRDFVTKENELIKIIQEPFSDKLAKIYSRNDKKILFICSIATITTPDKTEENIQNDMNDQIRWVNIIKPYGALLKFSLPRIQRTFEFFQGDLLLDLWSSKNILESRLIVNNDPSMIIYDCTEYERSLTHFHNITRTIFYEHDFDYIETEGIDHCYDCRAELFILQEYLIKVQNVNDDKELKKSIAQVSYDISRNIYEKHQQPFINCLRTLNIIPKK